MINGVKKPGGSRQTRAALERAAAVQRMELYFMVHPGSPSAVRRPRLQFRSGKWMAVLGDKLKDGISGMGRTVEEALNAFDLSYLSALHPPVAEMPARKREAWAGTRGSPSARA